MLLSLLLAAVVAPLPLRAQGAEPQAFLPPMPQVLPRQVSVPDVRLPGATGSVTQGAVLPSKLDSVAPRLAYPLAELEQGGGYDACALARSRQLSRPSPTQITSPGVEQLYCCHCWFDLGRPTHWRACALLLGFIG